MIASKRVLAVITARGGSKGLPRKNLLPFRGKPLLQWTIEAAQASAHIDRLILSSDDAEIRALAESLGCEAPFTRAAALSSDEARSIDVVLDAVDRTPGFDLVVLLQPTSPLRLAADIDGTLEALVRSEGNSAVSVGPAPCHPWLVFNQDEAGRLVPYAIPPAGAGPRRQDMPPAWRLNGAVYASDIDWLRRERVFVQAGDTVPYVMPVERSADIDTLEDLKAAEVACSD